MKLTEFLLADSTARSSVRARAGAGSRGQVRLEAARKSMIFGYSPSMVATIPSWIAMEVNRTSWTWRPPRLDDEAGAEGDERRP